MRGTEPNEGWLFAADPAERVLAAVAAGWERPAGSVDGAVFELACSHGLIGLLTPDDVVDRHELSTVQTRAVALGIVMRRSLRRLMERLAAAGIRAAVVKGPALADRLYPTPGQRIFTDLDLVVPSAELGRTLEIVASDPECLGIPPKRPRADKRDIPFRDPSGVVFNVDLHWDLFSYRQLRGRAAGATEQAWERARPPEPDQTHLGWLLPDEVVAAFLCTHALLDHRFRLVLFRDLVEVARHGLDWETAVRFAHDHGLAGFGHLAWSVASALGAAVPGEVLAETSTGGLPLRVARELLPRTDLVRFDGKRPHLLNLAVTLHADRRLDRAVLALRAPRAYPRWRRRVVASKGDRFGSVMVLVSSDRRRGAEVFGERLVEGLRARGWKASLVALRAGGSDPRVQVDDAVGGADVSDVALPRLLRRLLRRRRPDVVLANGGATLRTVVAATRFMPGRPRVVYSSIGEPRYWVRGPWHARIQRYLLGRCDRITAVSEATRSQLIDSMGVAPDRVTVAPTGVPDHWFELDPPLPHPELRVLVAGALSTEKDPLTAVQAINLAAADADVWAKIAGDGPLRTEVEAAAGPRIEVLGSAAEMEELFGWADVLLSTSRTEGLPGVVLEAAAAGRPVVATRVGGTPEVVTDGTTGILVRPGDVEGAAAALKNLAADPERRRRMGAAARELARRYTMGASIDRYEQVLRSTIDG